MRKLSEQRKNALAGLDWLLPTVLAALAATRLAPLAAPAVWLLLGWLPGRCLLRGLDLAGNWDRAARFLLAVAASLTIAPVFLNPVWHATNDPWRLVGYSWLLLTAAGVFVRLNRRTPAASHVRSDAATPLRLCELRRTKLVLVGVALLVVFAAVGTYWPTELRGYPVPALIHDFIKHHAVLFSLEQRPLPLGNPFFADEAAGPVYYYHFFYLMPATVRAVAPAVSIELAFGIQAALVGLTMAGMFYLLVKRFTGADGPATLAALLATLIGGLDVLPILALRLPAITLDAWADTLVRIHNFFTQIVWTPQNLQGVLVMLVGICALSLKGWWRGWFVLGPLLAAALIGSTVWVAAGVMPGLVIFVALEIWRARRRPPHALHKLAAAAAVGVLMLVISLPSLAGYLEMSRRHGKGLTFDWPYQQRAVLGRLVPPGPLANLLDLPWVLTLEFGPLLILPLLLPRRTWRQAWADPGWRLLLISAGVALLGFIGVRSDFYYNDFGQKIILVAMSAGLVLAACIISPRAARPRWWNPLGWTLHEQSPQRPRRLLAGCLAALLLLGLPVGVYQSPLAAIRRHLPTISPFGVLTPRPVRRAAAEAPVNRFLRYQLPPDAVLQAHWTDERLDLAQLARRQLGVTVLEEDTMVFFPNDLRRHQEALRAVAEALGEPVPARECYETLRAHRITHVLVGKLERARWEGLEKFADQRYFTRVFASDNAAVYTLRSDD